MTKPLTTKAKIILLTEIILACFFVVFWDVITAEYILFALKHWGLLLNAGSICFILSASSLCIVFLISFFSQALRKKNFLDYGLHKKQIPDFKTIGLLSLLALIIQLACLWLIEIPAEHFLHIKVDFPAINSLNSYIWFLFTAIFGAGIREELFLRGYLLNKIRDLFPSGNFFLWTASIIQILFFALGHSYQGPVGTFEAVLSGSLFTIIYLRSKSLWNAIILHSTIDIWGFTLLYLYP